jgi:hypothetical protein
MTQDNSVRIGCGADMLFWVFLILKLTHVIDWSWWWVTSPMWIPAIFILLFVVLLGILD